MGLTTMKYNFLNNAESSRFELYVCLILRPYIILPDEKFIHIFKNNFTGDFHTYMSLHKAFYISYMNFSVNIV